MKYLYFRTSIIALALLGAQTAGIDRAGAQEVKLPVVKDGTGYPVPAAAEVLVDTTGAAFGTPQNPVYVSGGTGGGGGGGTSGGTATSAAPSYTDGSTGQALSLDLAGNLRTKTVLAGTLPAFAATPTFNIGTAPTIAVTGTFWQSTQPVSVASLPLPSGAATAANQTAVQSAPGTSAATAFTVQGSASGVAIPVNCTTGCGGGGSIPTGSAGTPSTSVITLQGIAGMTPITTGGITVVATASFTTPSGTTAYASGNLIANSATAASVVPLSFTNACRVNGGTAMIRRVRLKSADSGFAGGTVLIKFYQNSPTIANGDHAAWSTSESGFIGDVSVTYAQAFTDYQKGIGAPGIGSEANFACASGSTTIYGLLVAGSAITPVGAQSQAAEVEILQN